MTAPETTRTFADDAVGVVRALRAALSEAISGTGADPNDAQSIGRVVGLNKNLAWKVSKIVQADDPVTALEQVPGGTGLKILLEALEKAGAPESGLTASREAVGEYERLIEVHTGDRQTLEMMMIELSPQRRRQRDEQHRKQLYQGGSYVWGVQTRVNLKIGIVGPGARPGLLDFASVNGLIGFRRLRPDVAWTIASRRSRNDDGSEMATDASEPLDPAMRGTDGAPLMPEFCSQPLPSLRRTIEGTTTRFEFVEGPVGKRGALTCVVGAVQRDIPYYRTPENRWGEHSALSDIPAEWLIMDVFLHRQFEFAAHPETFLYSELRNMFPYASADRDRHRLPLNEPLQTLGSGPLPLATPEVPRYNDMVRSSFERLGWNPEEFFGFRMKVAYPAYPTALVMRYDLPEAP